MVSSPNPIELFAAAAGGTALALGLAWFVLARPRVALACCYVLVLVAGTKLRQRPVTDSLEGAIDFQIILELSLYTVVGIVVATLLVVRWRRLQPLAPAEIVLGLYAGLALLSTWWSPIPGFTAARAMQAALLYALAVASVRFLGPGGAVQAASVSLVLYVMVCATAVITSMPSAGAYTATDFLGYTRFTWFALHPIAAGTYAGLAAVLVAAVGLAAPSGWRARRFVLPSWLCFAVVLTVLILTYSRGPMLACAAAVTLLVLKTVRLRTVSALMAAIGLVIIVAIVTSDAQPGWSRSSTDVVTQALSRGQTAEELTGLTGRIALWEAAFPLFVEKAALGHGYHGSRARLIRYANWAAYAHNALLQTLLDLGFVGALLLWPVVAWTLWRALITRLADGGDTAEHRAFLTGATVFLFVNALTSESFAGTPSYEILLVFLAASVACHTRAVVRAGAAMPATRPAALGGVW